MKRILPLVLVLLLAAAARPVSTDDDDYDRARDALARDAVRPLAEIMEPVEARLSARIIQVEFESQGPTYVYEFELMTPDCKLIEIEVDAATGEPADEYEGER
ncbi:MAG: putative membrane protein YkoI [Paracoccaceae bacterium]|jgi:uncharacterized membrane protein YkoI